jgi:hypothetical protein
MRLSQSRSAVSVRFDDPNLVSCAGLVPVMRLAETTGLAGLVTDRIRLGVSTGAHPDRKIISIVAGMIAGADCIDDLDLLRHGGMSRVFTAVAAPSTLGSFLRSFSWGDTRALESAARVLLARLATATPLLPGGEEIAYVDIDALLRRTFDKHKQGAGFGHAKAGGYSVRLRGLSPLVATISTPAAAPVIAATRLRGGNAAAGRGGASLVTEAITTARHAGCGGLILVRADSAHYGGAVTSACRRAGARFSITTRSDPKIRAAIASIGETAWTPVRYPGAVFDADTGQWISNAEVAEVGYTAFEGSRHEITARLIVRRVKDLNPDHQNALFPVWRYHAFLTDTTLSTVDADLVHRQHAIIEQVFADLIDGPLAHLPSGKFAANAAWLTCAAIAHNLLHAAGTLTSREHAVARAATLRRQIINVPARIARRARRLILHLPAHWPWQNAWHGLFLATHAPPKTA